MRCPFKIQNFGYDPYFLAWIVELIPCVNKPTIIYPSLSQVKVPHSDIYSYCKPPLSVKVDTNKENIVDMVADVSTLDILDEEIKVIDESQQSKDNEETLFPDYGKFKSKIFHERIKVLTDSGAKISKVVGEKYLRNHEYDESFPNFEPKDGSTSSQSEMSVPVVERRTSKRKLFVQENPELFDDEEVSTWSNDEANNSFKNFCVECESRQELIVGYFGIKRLSITNKLVLTSIMLSPV